MGAPGFIVEHLGQAVMSAATFPTDYVRAPRELVRKAHRLAQSAQTTNDYRTGTIAMEIEAPLAVLLAQPGELTSASTWSEIRERINLPPRPEWTSANTVNVNAKLKGWESFFEGRSRDNCPFPPARPDLKTAYQEGWDAAKSAPPRPGEIRVIDGKRCRFIERELEGEKWEVLGPADPPLTPNDIGRYDDILGREVTQEDLSPPPAREGAARNPTSGDTDCVSLLADLDAGKPCMAEAAEMIRLLIAERDASEKAGFTPIASGAEVWVRMRLLSDYHSPNIWPGMGWPENHTPGNCIRSHPDTEALTREVDELRAQTLAREDAQPVAWLYRYFGDVPWQVTQDERQARDHTSEVQPLYTHPDPDALREAGGPLGATADVQVSDVVIRRMVEAHDAEEAAQKGEPSPWREDLGAVDDPAWVSERMTAMRCAVEAGRFTPAEAPSAYLFRVDGKWELSIVDPRERLSLKPEDVVQVPISAQPTATFVAKAKHLLDLAEEAEVKALEGDEGCVWPVEALRAAYAALPFVMTITLGGDHAED